MADLGLMQIYGGIGQGFQNAVSGYFQQRQAMETQRRMSEDQAMRQKQMELGALNNGYKPDENGNWVPTPEKQLALQQQQVQYQQQQKLQDPSSQESQNLRQLNRASMDQLYGQGAGEKMIPETMSGAQLQTSGNEGLLKSMASSYGGLMGKQAMAQAIGQRTNVAQQGLDLRKQGLDLRQQEQGLRVNRQQTQDPVMVQLTKTSNSLNRGVDLLNGKQPVTATTLRMAQQDLINSVAGGAATEGKVNREMIDDFNTTLNGLAQKFGAQKDLRESDPKTVEYIKQLMNQIKMDFDDAKSNRSKELGAGLGSIKNPYVQDVLKSNQAQYQPAQRGLIQPQITPEDQQAISWAQSNPNDPRAQKILQMHGVK